jgi:3-hydroxyisobutyrate dehydrogenase-like beta-hydroxyacid dehydrogenase
MPDVPASKGYKDGFATRHMIKDLCLAIAAAEHVGAALPMGREAKTLYEQVGHYERPNCCISTQIATASLLLPCFCAGG